MNTNSNTPNKIPNGWTQATGVVCYGDKLWCPDECCYVDAAETEAIETPVSCWKRVIRKIGL